MRKIVQQIIVIFDETAESMLEVFTCAGKIQAY